MAQLEWHRKSEQVKENLDPLIAKIGRFKLTVDQVHSEFYVTLWVMKYNGSYFRIDHGKALSLKEVMEKGENLLKRLISIDLEKIQEPEPKSHSGETVKVLIDGIEHSAIVV